MRLTGYLIHRMVSCYALGWPPVLVDEAVLLNRSILLLLFESLHNPDPVKDAGVGIEPYIHYFIKTATQGVI